MKVLVTGAKGQLGIELQRALAGQSVMPLDLPELDITDPASIGEAVRGFAPEVVVHAAAMTDVDGCERNPEAAFRVNRDGTRNVALACREVGASIVYISTDFVFDGTKGSPYFEDDAPSPQGVYAASKLAGERHIQDTLENHYIVRTAWLYGPAPRNFVQTILRLADERPELYGVTDEVGSPTWARDLAGALAHLVEHPTYGMYHLTGEGACSRYDFTRKILDLGGKAGARLVPLTTAEYHSRYPSPTKRPANGALANRAARALGVTMRPWEIALEEYVCSSR